MSEVVNPYIAGNPVTGTEMFFGRNDVFEFIQKALTGQHRDNVIVLYGQRRTGKTSVMYQMSRHLDARYLCIFIDMSGLAMEGLGGLLWEMANYIQRALKRDHQIDLPRLSRSDFTADPRSAFENDFLGHVWSAIGDRHILLMLDEAIRLQEQIQAGKLEKVVFEYLRHLMQAYDRLNFLFSLGSGLEEMEKEYAFLFSVGLYKKISFLERDAAAALITQPVQDYYQVAPAAAERILQVTSGHAYYTQLLCHSLFNRWQQQRQAQVQVADVNAILDEVIERGLAVLKHVWEESTSGEKAVLAGLAACMGERNHPVRLAEVDRVWAQHGVPLPPGEKAKAIQGLIARDIIRGQDKYAFTVDLQRLWALKYERIEWVKEEIARDVEIWRREPVVPVVRRSFWRSKTVLAITALVFALLLTAVILVYDYGRAWSAMVSNLRAVTTRAAEMATATAQAAATASNEAPIGMVILDNATLRDAPDQTGRVIGLVPRGLKLIVISRSANRSWLRVIAADETRGWITPDEIDLDRSYIDRVPISVLIPTPTPGVVAGTPTFAATTGVSTPTITPALQQTLNYVVLVLDSQPVRDSGGLNLRAARDLTAGLVDRAQIGEPLGVYDRVVDADGTVWLYVESPRGRRGWARENQGDISLAARTDQPVPMPGYTATPTPPTASTPAANSTVSLLLDRINKLRAENGLAPYQVSPQLMAAALQHSQDMANTGNIGHVGSDGSTAAQRIRAGGSMYAVVGEIIYGGSSSLDDAWSFWTNDPPQRANLLSTQYTDIGIGLATSGVLAYYTIDLGAQPVTLPTDTPTPTPAPTPVGPTPIVVTSTIDLLAYAREAIWSNGDGVSGLWLDVYPTASTTQTDRGFAAFVPGDKAWASGQQVGNQLALETHPQAAPAGEIRGDLPFKLPDQGAQFSATLEFLLGAEGSDGVHVEIWWMVADRTGPGDKLAEAEVNFDSPPVSINADLSSYGGQTGDLVLRISPKKSAGADWLTWRDVRVTPK